MQVRKRFLVSLLSNIIRTTISFITGLFLARAMGPVDYGRMSFLMTSFLAFRQLLDMGTSSAFFTFLSQRPRSQYFINFYWCWNGLQFFLTLLVLGILLPNAWIAELWKGEKRSLVILAFVATFMQNIAWVTASQMAEAHRETILIQRLNTIIILVHFIACLGLCFFDNLAIPFIFIAIILEWAIASWLAKNLYPKQSYQNTTDTVETGVSVFREYWYYCLPFVPHCLLGFIHDFGDRWMLQHWGGAKEQAYFSVANQFAAISLLATTSILRIFWKEIAEAHHREDCNQMKTLYFKISRGLYFIGAVVSGGLIPWTNQIIHLTLGESYSTASTILLVMLFYPLHQSLGQIGGTLLMATGKTRAQVLIGITYMAFSLIISYFLMAPANAFIPGLSLASYGLAYKMVFAQFIQINLMAWVIARIFKWKYDWSFQLIAVAVTLPCGWIIKMATFHIFTDHTIIAMIVSVPLYFTCILIFLSLIPWVAGTTRSELYSMLRATANKFKFV